MRWWIAIVVLAGCWSSTPTTSAPDRTPIKTSSADRCPGAPRRPGCHGPDECVCVASPASTGGCGIRPPAATFGCKVDVDCGAEVCLKFDEGCMTGTRCAPRCRAGGCGRGNVCQLDGHCGPELCTAGWDCSAYGTCSVGSSGADVHGCIAFTCATDANCPCTGFCVNRRCEATPGECAQPRG